MEAIGSALSMLKKGNTRSQCQGTRAHRGRKVGVDPRSATLATSGAERHWQGQQADGLRSSVPI